MPYKYKNKLIVYGRDDRIALEEDQIAPGIYTHPTTYPPEEPLVRQTTCELADAIRVFGGLMYNAGFNTQFGKVPDDAKLNRAYKKIFKVLGLKCPSNTEPITRKNRS